jgi:hypothetical protein
MINRTRAVIALSLTALALVGAAPAAADDGNVAQQTSVQLRSSWG